jgi:hypothetical protein
MRFFFTLLFTLLLSSSLQAYTDMDLDGVDDSMDLCLDTPFDLIVDARGCPYDKTFLGKLTLQIGGDFSFDSDSDDTSNLNLLLNYSYRNWNISLSDTNYETTNLNELGENTNNLYLTAGYLFAYESWSSRLSVGTKFDLGSHENRRDNDFYASVNLEYSLNNRQTVFLYYSYTLSGDSSNIDYDNFHSTSLGTGYAVTQKWYSALSYNHATAYYPGYDDYRALSWFNSYTLSENVYLTCNYAYALDDLSYDHIISLNLGVHFD